MPGAILSMPSRSQMDTPATVAAAILGVVLIAASLPFLIFDGGSDDTRYSILWTEEQAGTAQATSAAGGASSPAVVEVLDALPSNATVTLASCDETSTGGGTVTITWTLLEGANQLDSGTFTCADEGSDAKVALGGHPDVGTAKAGSRDAAARKAYAGGDNRSAEYTLQFTWARSGGLPLLPLPSTFNAALRLDIDTWRATAQEPDQEVPR